MEKVNYTVDGEDKFFLIRKPGSKEVSDAQIESSKLFSKLVKSDESILFRSQLDEYMVKHGLLTEDKAREIIEISGQILEKQKILEAGGIKLKEGRKIAIELMILRNKYVNLTSARTSLDSNTVEGQVENTRFDYIVINCILDEEGNKVFQDIYQYRDDNRNCVYEAASKVAAILYGIEEDAEKDLPENKFLRKYGFVNDDLELVDSEGNYVDIEGNPIKQDENEVEFSPFLDDEGNEVD